MKLNPNEHISGHSGMTVRAEIAAKIMAGMAGDVPSCWEDYDRGSLPRTAKKAVALADALIAELNK